MPPLSHLSIIPLFIVPLLITHLLLGLLLAGAVAALACKVRALTWGGAFAAWAVGTAVFGAGGWAASAALLAFFLSSSILSRWRKRRKETFGYEKGGRRDAGQVLANGGVAAICILLPVVGVKSGALLFLAALAAANADTWATEAGSALGGQPYDIRTWRKVPAGTSGAISLPGTAAALAGAGLIGVFARDLHTGLIVAASGFGGALFDSLLGTTVQAQWRDPAAPDHWTETPQSGPPERGWRGIGNDYVNLFCTLMGAGLAAILLKIFLRN